MINELVKTVSAAQMPVLWWSSGLESTLLLAMMREANLDFYIVQMRDFWTKEQKKKSDDLIKEWNLKVFSYSPANVYFIGNDSELTTVFEYAVGGTRIPVLRDVIDGTRCIADLDGLRLHSSPMKWDLNIIGSRKDDSHYAFDGQVIPSKRWQHGDTEFYAPLFDRTRDEVIAMSNAYGLDTTEVDETEDTGNISLCTNCLQGHEAYCPKENTMIPPIEWDRTENLQQFQRMYS
jgi:hypothetical protein